MNTSRKILLVAALAVIGIALYPRQTALEKEVRHLRRGQEYFERGEFEKARVEYRNAAKLMPVDPEISYRWGLVDEAQGDIRNAYANFLRAEQQNPHYAPALLKIAHYQLVVEQYEEVQKRLDTVLADHPDNADAHALLGALKLRRKDFEGTRKEAEFALSRDSGNITAFSVLTGLYLAQNDLPRAEATVDAGIARNPGDLSLRLLKVKMFEKPLNIEKINQTYQDIIRLQPGDMQLRTVLSDIYLQADRKEDAEATLRNAVHDIPDNWQLKQRLVSFLGKHKNVDAAEKEIQSYMQAFPDRHELYFWLAELYLNHDQTDKAVALLEQIVSKETSDRHSLQARSTLARINFHKGNKELAQNLVDAVLAKAPANPDALFVRARIAADDGRYQSAITDLRMIIRDNPKRKDALHLLAEVLLLQGYADLAIETLGQLVEIDPANTPAQVRLAQMYNENRDPQRALKILALAAKSDPGYPVTWESMARIAIGMKDEKTALMAMEKLKAFKGQEAVVSFLGGQLAQAAGAGGSARETYISVIRADPTTPLAERAVFELVEKHKSPQELQEIVDLLVSLNTDSPYIHTILGESYLALNRPDMAATAFDRSIANNSPLAGPYLNRARLYLNDGNTDEAVALLEKATRANPADTRAELMLADIYNRQQKYAESIRLYDSILQRFPDLEIPANNMAALIADHAYTDPVLMEKAVRTAQRFSAGKNPDFTDTLAWIYYRQNKPEQAQPVMARAMAMAREVTPEMHYHYGAILIQAGNKVKGREELEKAISPAAPPTVADQARELLKTLEE